MLKRGVTQVILSRVIGFLFFLILLVVANILVPNINSSVYGDVVRFLNSSVILLLMITFFGMINDLFWSFNVPFNVLAPITSGILSIFIVTFFYKIWSFIDFYINSGVGVSLISVQIIVFLFVVVFGYITILSGIGKPAKEWEKEWKRRHEELWESKMNSFERRKHGVGKKTGKGNLAWEKVEDEFKLVFYNIGRSINKMFEGKKGKKAANRKLATYSSKPNKRRK